MSWQTTGSRSDGAIPIAEDQVAVQAQALLMSLGREGWSCPASHLSLCLTSSLPDTPEAAPLAWLTAAGLIAWEPLTWYAARTIRIVRLTTAGKAYLHAHRQPVVRSEIEILQDRCGHTLHAHYGQCLLFAALARQAGYHTRLCVTLPTRTAIADVGLERQGTRIWVSVESGLERSMHPLDRWHRLAQVQAWLPLVAPTPEGQRTVEKQARTRIYVLRSTSLISLLARPRPRYVCLWNRRYNRFEEQAAQLARPPSQPDWDTWTTGHAAMHRIGRRTDT